jgi:septal ring factor EnvC (AmiA/AmiB activator)
MSAIFKSMKVKKKRTMDPDVYRPNLFAHEQQIKDTKQGIAQGQEQIQLMARIIQRMERKIARQDTEIEQLRNAITRK